MLTTEFIAELQRQNFSNEEINKAVFAFDTVLQNYNLTKREANIIAYDKNNTNKYLFDMYMASRHFQGYSKGTLNNIRTWLGKYLECLNVSALEAQPMHVRLFLAKYQTKKNGQPMKKSSLEKIKQIISSFYNLLIQERQTTYNPAANVQSMKIPFKYQGALTSEEIATIKYACKNTRERFIVEFLLSSGCRIAEFVNIKRCEVDKQERAVKVLGKGNKERIVYFSAEAKLLMEEYYKERKDNCEYLLCTAIGGHSVATNSVRETIKTIYDRVSNSIHLDKLTPHTFRRTFAMIALRRGMTLEQISKLLGHANLQTTMRYLELEQTDLQAQHFKLVA